MPDVTEIIQTCRQEVIERLDGLEALWERSDIVGRPAGAAGCRSKLADDAYKVLVVGEAKRGKSSLINAVIGRDLLPTDVDISTCQVFRMRRADREAVRIRYEDGSEQRIEAAEIPRYGAQAYADSEVPAADELIRWIEIDVPAKFLPPEIELLDTPGLGSLYAGHAEITQRFVPLADGVVFVLGSNHPISDVEVGFLERLVEVTRSVFFIQTMIDLHRRADWEAIRRRNEQVIEEKFGRRLGKITVWPISNTNLRRAGETNDEDYLRVSRFPDLARALQSFLFRASGWNAMAEGLIVAQQAQSKAEETLEARRRAVQGESVAKRRELRELVAARRAGLERDWGPSGECRRRLLENVDRHASLARQSIQQALHPLTGDLVRIVQTQIEKLNSIEQAQVFAARLNDNVLTAACAHWRKVCETATQKTREELRPLLDRDLPEKSGGAIDPSSFVALPAVGQIEVRYFERVKAGVIDAGVAGFAANISLTLAGSVLPFLAPIMISGAAVAVLAGAVRGGLRAMSQELQQAKHQLRSHLANLLQCVQHRFFAVDQESGRYGVADEFCRSLKLDAAKAVDEITSRKRTEIEGELAQLDTQMRMTEQERLAQSEQISRSLEEWKAWARRLEQTAARLRELDELLGREAATPTPSA